MDQDNRGKESVEANNHEAKDASEDDELEGCEGVDEDDLDVEEVLIEM